MSVRAWTNTIRWPIDRQEGFQTLSKPLSLSLSLTHLHIHLHTLSSTLTCSFSLTYSHIKTHNLSLTITHILTYSLSLTPFFLPLIRFTPVRLQKQKLLGLSFLQCTHSLSPSWCQFHQRSMSSFACADPKSVKKTARSSVSILRFRDLQEKSCS